MQQFEEYRKAKQKLLEYFGNPPEYYPITAMLDVQWTYDSDVYTLYWTDDESSYSVFALSSYDAMDYMMFLVDNNFGDKELFIFDKQKESKDASK